MIGDTVVSFRRKRGEKQKSLAIFGRDYNKEYYELQLELAQEYYDRLIRNIRRNTFEFKLSVATLKSRRRKGITSTVPFIETGDYLKAIFVKGVTIKIKEGIHKPSGLRYSELFNILEFGRRDKSIPARPVFRRTREEFEPIMAQRINALTQKYLRMGIEKRNRNIN